MVDKALIIAANEAGGEILPDNKQWTNRIEIKSETSSRYYIVAQNKANHTWGCSCFAYKRYRKCKHLTTMLPSLQAIGAPARSVR